MAVRRYRVLFAEDSEKLEALIAQPHYAGWTFFESALPFSELEADSNFDVVAPDTDRLSITTPGVFTVGFAP